ncbi:sugar ABC transporter permease [Vulcanibacillus modesticaldus]|uniref:Sugar ABC transporter permease n=1 Tax=Vulcanibacillus modesticaldus TaxID=337097 RepID=A0A1D2YY08_9BACI|nr:ABC transporter permease [Vulcanibacillus modesticaldus]OEG00466.1 sugar ABC transporter permease [Vulcanibacillus modesticaldus]
MSWLGILSDLMHNTIVFSTALILAALGGLFSERSGIVNIALEGLMIVGAFTSAVVTHFVDQSLGGSPWSPWIGFLVAIVAGLLFSLIHAVATVSFNSDHVVSGVALNFLALGATVYLTKIIFNGAGQTKTLQTVFTKWEIPYLSDIPYIGKAFFTAYPTSYLAIILVFVSYYVLWKTPFGLRLRSVGEHPKASDTMGINVYKMKYIGVMLSGVFAAMGGASIALTTTSNFSHTTISGQGFIALAVLIFGKWNPFGILGAGLFFGIAQALNSLMQVFELTKYVPVDFIFMLPYVLTILVLAGLIGKAIPPKAIGKPYVKGSR